MPETLPCTVYKSPRRDLLYLYVRDEGDFSTVPTELLKGFGEPQQVMRLELDAERRLANAEVTEVMASLREQGFYLQMPPKEPWL